MHSRILIHFYSNILSFPFMSAWTFNITNRIQHHHKHSTITLHNHIQCHNRCKFVFSVCSRCSRSERMVENQLAGQWSALIFIFWIWMHKIKMSLKSASFVLYEYNYEPAAREQPARNMHCRKSFQVSRQQTVLNIIS